MGYEEPAQRVGSLDQFRGYTVLGMFVVNFVGGMAAVTAAMPLLKHHHTYCSYADTIMPGFFFAVGFAYRLTFLRRQGQEGTGSAVAKAVRRSLGLILLGVVWYLAEGGPRLPPWSELTREKVLDVLYTHAKRDVFQTLTHIGVTSLWVLPVIAGLLVSVPLSMLTSRVSLGRRLRDAGLLITPEESAPSAELLAVQRNVGYTWSATADASVPLVPRNAPLHMEPAPLTHFSVSDLLDRLRAPVAQRRASVT